MELGQVPDYRANLAIERVSPKTLDRGSIGDIGGFMALDYLPFMNAGDDLSFHPVILWPCRYESRAATLP